MYGDMYAPLHVYIGVCVHAVFCALTLLPLTHCIAVL